MARGAAKTKRKSIYGVHPGVAMVRKWIDDLPAKTGRSLDEWLKFIKKSGPKTEKERRDKYCNFHRSWPFCSYKSVNDLETGEYCKRLCNVPFSPILPFFFPRIGNTWARLCHPTTAENHLSTLNTNHAQEGV
ncbi:MAG TPA: hypothetical protein VI837_11665 [Blastocatellia bacterium]|nr:hypothetical protein [Blastocatellia bacterium]